MSCPNMAEFIILLAPFAVILTVSSLASAGSNVDKYDRDDVNLKAINSTIITAPSMIIPKSIAPKLIRLASIPKMYIKESAKNKHNGITEATTKPLRQLPSIKITTKRTIRNPKIRFSVTVKVVFAISSLRSNIGFMNTPSGKVFCVSATRAFTASITTLALAPFSIIIWPITFSPSPLAVIAPKRVETPNCTFAMSRTSTGVPFRLVTTISAIWSISVIKPSPRMK